MMASDDWSQEAHTITHDQLREQMVRLAPPADRPARRVFDKAIHDMARHMSRILSPFDTSPWRCED